MKKDSWLLFGMQALAHLAFVYLVFNGTPGDWLICFAVYFVTGCFGITMTYHRLLSHKAWNAPNWWYYFGSLCGAYGLVGSPLAWVSTHRAHHRDSDGPTDPHSPIQKPWWRVQWFSMFDAVGLRYGLDLLRNHFQMTLHKQYFMLHATVIVAFLLINPALLIPAYLAPAALLWNAGSCINTINHKYGYRNYETKDNSQCNLILGFFVFGEGWHNNHHAFPASASFQSKWWEFDLGYWFVKKVEYVSKL